MPLNFQSITMNKQMDFQEINGCRNSAQSSIISHLICTENISEHFILMNKKKLSNLLWYKSWGGGRPGYQTDFGNRVTKIGNRVTKIW